MSCKKSWNLDFLFDNFTKKFVTITLKHHREQQLYDRETALLPATQPLVERHLQKERLKLQRAPFITQRDEAQKVIVKTTRKLYKVQQAYWSNTLYNDQPVTHSFLDICEKENEAALVRYREVQARITTINRRIRSLNQTDENPQEAIQKEKRAFVRKCPQEDCRGFLSTQYKCGICENYTCNECMEVVGPEKKDERHVCKPENIATVKLLAKDTKPCPRCGELIHKHSGCAQMFCTTCHTVWNWNTSTVVQTGPIHNPHYFEWRNRNNANTAPPRPIGDVPCGGLPDSYLLNLSLRKHDLNIRNIEGMNLLTYMIWVGDLHDIERGRYLVNHITDNLDLRIKFMIKEIDEKRFKQLLQMREKAQNKKREIEQVIAMIYNVSGDILRNMIDSPTLQFAISKAQELKELVEYARSSFDHIAKKYNCTTPNVGRWVYGSPNTREVAN